MQIEIKDLKYMGGLLDVLRTNAVERKEATDNHRERIANIDRVYIKDTKQYKEVTETAKKEYAEKTATLKQVAADMCKKQFEKIKGDLQKHVAVPIPADMMQQIEYLEKYGKNLTPTERNLIVEQCKGNYQAIRAANKYINPQLKLQGYDEMLADVNQLEKFATDCINGKSTEYMHNLMLFGGIEKTVDNNLHLFFGCITPENNE